MTARSNWASRRGLLTVAAGTLVALVACNDNRAKQASELPLGSIQSNPQNGLKFVVDSNRAGQGSNLRVSSVDWGRLVDVYAPDNVTGLVVPVFDDYLVAADVEGDGVNLTLARQPGSGTEILTILHPFGSAAFKSVLASLDDNLQQVIDKSLSPIELPPFTAVPRNGAIVLTFDDLIDASTITSDTVKVRAGYPPTSEFACRIVPDLNHGDIIDGVFHTTRVIVDLTVSESEAATSGLTVNAIGLPEAQNTAQAGGALRLPTRTVAGQQFQVLTNLAGRSVAFTGNGSTDNVIASLDVVRAFRAGGRTVVTGDPFNGFLPDDTPPRVLSAQGVQVTAAFAITTGYLVDLQFASAGCAVQPRAGDLLAMHSGVFARVLQDGVPPVSGVVNAVQVAVIDPLGSTVSVGPGEYRQPWVKSTDQASRPECWVTVQPAPANGIDIGIETSSTFSLQFSEPMDPASLSGFDTMQLLYGFATPTVMQSRVVGPVRVSGDLARYTLQPSLPLRHATNGQEAYQLALSTGAAGVVDLAGNEVQVPLTDVGGSAPTFTVLATEVPIESRSVSLRFAETDEDPLTNAGNELRGQVIYDLQNSRIRPRSVTRISGICDLSTPYVQVDIAAGGAVATSPGPFMAHGARWMTTWRYCDLGFLLLDDATHNLDVEGLNWAPASGSLQVDTLPEFQMSISHCKYLPDEFIDPMAGILFPNSSISDIFLDNVLDPVNDPLLTVHPKAKGYTVEPIELFTSASGTQMGPWPMNQDAALEDYVLYTWRDNSITTRGQPNNGAGTGGGAALRNEIWDTANQGIYPLGSVPTIALPLLMDFRTFPNAAISANNTLLGLFAINNPAPPPIEIAPFFTALTYGGVQANGVAVDIDPDQQQVAAGGIPPGTPGLLARNQFIMFGQGDFVVRVNRAHTRWFECAPGAAGAPFSFADPVIEPSASSLPPGTQVLLHYRGATSIVNTGSAAGKPWENAANIDPYGAKLPNLPVSVNFNVTFNGGNSWRDTIQQINGSQFFQARITLVSNVLSGATPEVTALGFAFSR